MSGDPGDAAGENEQSPQYIPPPSSYQNHDVEYSNPPTSNLRTTNRWDRIRDAVRTGTSETLISVNSRSTQSSPVNNASGGSPISSRTTTPISAGPRPYHRNALFSPFTKSHQPNNHIIDHHQRAQNSFMATTISAAQAAGMNNYGRHFGRHFQGETGGAGGIYATTTSVQQDIYRLERDLQKVLHGLNTWNRHASFSTTSSPDDSLEIPINSSPQVTQNIHQIQNIMSSILETIQNHKLSNRLPLLNEVLTVLKIPFHMPSIQANDCNQALDIFDYIHDRFKYFDVSENFEMLLFCSRLLVVDHQELKVRIISTLKRLISSSTKTSNKLPSSPSAFHSLVYTVTDALAHHQLQMSQSHIDPTTSNDTDPIYNDIIDLLDRLSNGNLIPILGKHWDRYSTLTGNESNHPVSIAQLCVVEGLCKTLMVGRYGQIDPYKGESVVPQNLSFENAREKLVLQTLLKRYWLEPTSQTHPAFLQVLFVLAEAAIEKFLNGFVMDLLQPTSTVRQLWNFMQDKLPHSKLGEYLPNMANDRMQEAVATNITHASMAIMSITHLRDTSQLTTKQHSPNLTPHPSNEDMQGSLRSPAYSTSDNIFDVSETDLDGQQQLQPILNTIKNYVVNLWKSGCSSSILSITQAMLEDSAGERSVTVYGNLALYLDDPAVSEEIVKKTLPTLFNRLTSTYPAPFFSLCQLLLMLSQKYRPIFYKPIVSCVASDDYEKVVSSLTLISCLRRYMSGVQLWMRDADMINVLLLSDVGRKQKQRQQHQPNEVGDFDGDQLTCEDQNEIKWGTTTLGQCVVAAEFLWTVRELRHLQQYQTRNMEEDEIAKKFLIDLERRFSVFMTAKEKLMMIPMPLRVILTNLLLDMRFFCNTTHRPGWLTRAIDWATQNVGTLEYFQQRQFSKGDHNKNNNNNATQADSTTSKMGHGTQCVIHLSMLNDITSMFEKMALVYATTLGQLEFESSEHIEYGGDRPMTVYPRNNTAVEDVHASVLNDPLALRPKRQLVISMMYPVNRQAASSLELSPPALAKSEYHKNMAPATELSKGRLEELSKIHHDPFAAVFSLLVAVFTTLTPQEFSKLVQPLWERFMNADHPHIFVPAAFLLMQCSEKIPKEVIQVTSHDFYSDDPRQRMQVILKNASLSAYRFNILAQDYILISSKRKPFRGDGGAFATPFVPTDLGTNRFTMDEPRWMAKLKNASNFPIELKRQIQELGWDDEDKGEEYEALKKVLTPLTLLPSLYLDEEYDRMEDADTATRGGEEVKSAVINKIITRRKRATVVSTSNVTFLSMVDSLNDDYGGVHSATRELLESYLRDDPDLFLRGLLGDLGKDDLVLQRDALIRISYLVNMQAKLPPAFTHILFNYLAGMLKWLTRETTKHGFMLMSLIHPIITQLVLSTNELSTRDLRKNKIETLLSSTGRFWFTHEQPICMFPRRLMDPRSSFTILDIPDDTFGVAMLRISHIQFLTNFLIRYPREVYAIKKTIQDYEPIPMPTGSNIVGYNNGNETHFGTRSVFPDLQYWRRGETELTVDLDCVTEETTNDIIVNPRPSQEQEDTCLLSLLRARVWLRFVDTLLNGLNKNYNDRKELERILGGVNDVITKHSTDYGLIGQALILYTRMVTRFKRLFSSSHGYGAFLAVLFKVYCQAENHSHIRSAITFAWCRFYAVHEESFVFQMLGILAPLILKAYTQSTHIGSWMISNLFSLMMAMDNPPRLGATSDVLGLQLQVELDDHERSIQERIDVVSNPMTMPLSTSILKPLARSVTAPIAPLVVNNYNNRPFHISDFIKLFLTIIAYDPGSLRAEQFVKIYRHLLPLLIKVNGLASLIAEGMSALVDVFAKFSKNAAPLFGSGTTTDTENNNNSSGDVGNASQHQQLLPDEGEDNGNNTQQQQHQQHAYGKYWQQNDRVNIKMEFVKLIRLYFKLQGALSEADHEKMGQVIRSLLRDHGTRGKLRTTTWVKDYLDDTVQSMIGMRNYTKALKKILQQILSQWKNYSKIIDPSGIYQGLTLVLQKGQGKSFQMNDIATLVKDRFITHGLSIVNGGVNALAQGKAVYDRFCQALVDLYVMILENSPLDVLCEIEKLVPTVSVMGKVVIPICLKFCPQGNYSTLVDSRFRRDPTDQWMRLLAYVLKACNHESILKYRSCQNGYSLPAFLSNHGLSDEGHSGINLASESMEHEVDLNTDGSTDSHNKKLRTSSTAVLLFTFGLIALKTILIRGGKSFDKLKGVWTQLAYFIKEFLVLDDSRSMAQQKKSRSGLNTPLMGPASPMLNDTGTRNSATNIHSAGLLSSIPISSTHLLFEFAGWNLLEFVMYYKTPLVLLLGAHVEEKVLGIGFSATASPYPTSPGFRTSSYTPYSINSSNSPQSPHSPHSPRSPHSPHSAYSSVSPQSPSNSQSPQSPHFPQDNNDAHTSTFGGAGRWKSWGHNTLSRKQRRQQYTNSIKGLITSENASCPTSPTSHQDDSTTIKQQYTQDQHQYAQRELSENHSSEAALSSTVDDIGWNRLLNPSFGSTSGMDRSGRDDTMQTNFSRPTSQQYLLSTHQQVTESRNRSVGNIQALLGLRSSSSLLSSSSSSSNHGTNKRIDIRTWTYGDALRKVTGEWILALRVLDELLPVDTKSAISFATVGEPVREG